MDGICAAESVADFVVCVRSRGSDLHDAQVKKFSADVGSFGAKASGASEFSDILVRKYAASDQQMLEIINACKTQHPPAGPVAGMSNSAPSTSGLRWEPMLGAFKGEGAVAADTFRQVLVCRVRKGPDGTDGWHAGRTSEQLWPNCAGEWAGKPFFEPGEILKGHGWHWERLPNKDTVPSNAYKSGLDRNQAAIYPCRARPQSAPDTWVIGKTYAAILPNCSVEWNDSVAYAGDADVLVAE